ncbi:hypothetical protein AURDEDRAFT_116127, partial [Auricularia subglabra TFB-10046 SS5]
MDEAAQYDQLASQQLETSLARLAEVRAPLHPVRKTPPEVLGLIFEYCWDPLPESTLLSEKPAEVRRRQRQPFQLAAVCRRWRKASLLCPKAWNSIELLLDDIPRVRYKYWVAYLSCMLGRSASVPLHIRIIRLRDDTTRDSKLIDPLVESMRRCDSLLLSATCILGDTDTLVPILISSTPALSTLHLRVSSESSILQQLSIFPSASRLTRIRTSFHFAHAQTQLPAVTFVALYEPVVSNTENDISAALSVFPNIYDLSLIDPSVRGVAPAPPLPKVVCNNVQLRIRHDSTPADHLALSDRFAFPRLTYLYLYGVAKASAARVDLAISLLPEAAPQL